MLLILLLCRAVLGWLIFVWQLLIITAINKFIQLLMDVNIWLIFVINFIKIKNRCGWPL